MSGLRGFDVRAGRVRGWWAARGGRARTAALAAACGTLAGTACGDGPSAPPPQVARLAFSVGAVDTLTIDEVHLVTVRALDAEGRPITGRRVTYTVADTSVVSLVPVGGDAVSVRALAAGDTRLRARVDGSATADGAAAELPIATFLPSAVVRVPAAVAGLGPQIVDDSLALPVEGRDHRGALHVPTPGRLRWSTSDAAVADVEAESGRIVARGTGRATLTVTLATRPLAGSAPAPAATTTFELAVQALTVPAAARVVPTQLPLQPGATARVTGAARDSGGFAIPILRTRYRSSNDAVATVDALGAVRAVAPGTATLTAIVNGRPATAAVTVADAPASAFALDVRFVGTPDPRLADVVRQAAGRWTRVITGDLVDQRVDLPADACDAGTPAIAELVDDVVLLVRIDRVDGPGRILALAGPCALRGTGARLPLVGTVVLDSADLSRLVATGGAADVVTHEFGHVLGFGTRWTTPGLPPLALDAGLPATRFVGPGARDAAAALGYVGDGQDVPLESGGGFGTRDAHWSETRFGRELMTGFYDPGVANPLSLVSVRAMGDIGYEISEVGAEPTSVLETVPGTTSPFALLRSIVAAPLAPRAYDVVRTAEWVVGAEGVARRGER